jgi:4-hydroxybenzoate polyprenyltransferase
MMRTRASEEARHLVDHPETPALTSRRHLLLRTLRGYLLLPHLAPVLVVELATAAFTVIAWGGTPPPGLLVTLLLAMLGGQLAIGAINELVDLPYDAQAKPEKPLVRGDVTIRGAQAMAVVGLVMMTAIGATLGFPAFALLALGTGLGIAYDLWLKRTPWSWLPYFLALPLLPVWVFVALGKPATVLLLLYPLGALPTVGVHLAQSLPDVVSDRAAGLRTASSRLGFALTFVVAWLLTLSAPVLAWLAAGRLGLAGGQPAIAAAAGIALIFLAVNLALFASGRRLGVAATFPLVALATLASGLAWAMAVAE